ncbi:hypothetical protein COEX109129_39915 [Corallococcus exiguus]
MMGADPTKRSVPPRVSELTGSSTAERPPFRVVMSLGLSVFLLVTPFSGAHVSVSVLNVTSAVVMRAAMSAAGTASGSKLLGR